VGAWVRAQRPLARIWAQLGLWPEQTRAWIAAVGVDGAALVRDCIAAGIALSAMDAVLDGVRVKQRLQGGEPALSALAAPRAACAAFPHDLAALCHPPWRSGGCRGRPDHRQRSLTGRTPGA
jgi:hypothetical protein